MKLSVAICTYNRAAMLGKTLASLVQSSALADPWEVVVVDNNSTDSTKAVCERYSEKFPLKYVFESRQGLSAARNRALREAEGDFLVFTDDDVIVDREWLAAYARAYSDFPFGGFFGGRILAAWPNGRPAWLRDESMPLISGLLVHYDRGSTVRLYSSDEPVPYGASFGITRAAIGVAGDFDTALGVVGRRGGRGEETDYFERLRAVGVPGVYVGTAVAWHRTDPKRLTGSYALRHGLSKTTVAGGGSWKWRGFLRASEHVVRGARQALLGRRDRYLQSLICAGIAMGDRHEREGRAA